MKHGETSHDESTGITVTRLREENESTSITTIWYNVLCICECTVCMTSTRSCPNPLNYEGFCWTMAPMVRYPNGSLGLTKVWPHRVLKVIQETSPSVVNLKALDDEKQTTNNKANHIIAIRSSYHYHYIIISSWSSNLHHHCPASRMQQTHLWEKMFKIGWMGWGRWYFLVTSSQMVKDKPQSVPLKDICARV